MAMVGSDEKRWRNTVNMMSSRLMEQIKKDDPHKDEMIKSFIEAFCVDVEEGITPNGDGLVVLAECFREFLNGQTLERAFKQNKRRGRPKSFDFDRDFAIGLTVLQLNRGWLKQEDVDKIPTQYCSSVKLDFDQQSLSKAYEQAALLFSMSEEQIKRIYKEVCEKTVGLEQCQSEEELAAKLLSLF